MPGVSREQVEQARRITAIEYLQRYEAYDLKRCGHDEYELISHDSFKINSRTSKWHWKSRDIGGVTALDFLIHVRGQAFTDSVRMLCNESPSLVPVPSIQKDKKPFILPTASPDCVRASAYLRSRGISQNVLAYCREQGLFYEDIPYHNVVFVANDITGKPRFACKRGTCGVNYKRDVEGSEKRFGCYIRPATNVSTENGTGNNDIENVKQNTENGTDNVSIDNIEHSTKYGTVSVYESIIDAMSHATLDELDGLPWNNKYRLALGGIYAPDPSKAPSVRCPTKPPAA